MTAHSRRRHAGLALGLHTYSKPCIAGVSLTYRRRPSDINEHLATLRHYASRVSSIAEMGVRGVVSTWAFLLGLTESDAPSKTMLGVDLMPCDYGPAIALGERAGVQLEFRQGDSASIDLPPRDLLFVDTWHVYAHLQRELNAHHASTRRYIILHDTQVDAVRGEALRLGQDTAALATETGYAKADIERGLQDAIDEFLEAHTAEWRVERVDRNNNGLTVLARTRTLPEMPAAPAESLADAPLQTPSSAVCSATPSSQGALHLPIWFGIFSLDAFAEARGRVGACTNKSRDWAPMVPGRPETYVYTQEADYYAQYAESLYAITMPKAGMDCLRHYEILAAGAVPFFVGEDVLLDTPLQMFSFPRQLVLQAMKLPGMPSHDAVAEALATAAPLPPIDLHEFQLPRYCALRDELLAHTEVQLTTRALAEYVIGQLSHAWLQRSSVSFAPRLLMVTPVARADYQSDMLYNGLHQMAIQWASPDARCGALVVGAQAASLRRPCRGCQHLRQGVQLSGQATHARGIPEEERDRRRRRSARSGAAAAGIGWLQCVAHHKWNEWLLRPRSVLQRRVGGTSN